MFEKESVNITEDEAALYDRQIRLWGLDAQKRLRAAKVLVIGLGGLGAEVVKNIVLSGIKSVVLLDHKLVSKEDACSQFLIDRKDLGKNRAESSVRKTQLLNPLVKVSCDTENSCNKTEEFFCSFDIVCATCCEEKELIRINEVCAKNKIKFFAGDVFGYYGYTFADLSEHEFAEEVIDYKKGGTGGSGEPSAKKQRLEEETRTIKKQASFIRLQKALGVDWTAEENVEKIKKTPSLFFILKLLLEFRSVNGRYPDTENYDSDAKQLQLLRAEWLETSLGVDQKFVSEDFWKYCFAELSPVCAVTGGILGQEILKSVSQKDAPHNNFFFFSGLDSTGLVDRIG